MPLHQSKSIYLQVSIKAVLSAWLVSFISIFGQTKIDIRGLESMNKSNLLQTLSKRLVYIKNKPASRWRANDAAFMVQQILRKEGFSDAEVSSEIKSPNHILLTVNEGFRLSLGNVEIVGDEDSEGLAELFVVPFRKNSPLHILSTPFLQSNISVGLDYVLNKLKSNGYWRAEVSLKEKKIDRELGRVNLVISVKKGRRFTIRKPTVDSPDGRGVKRAATTWQPYIGQWATTKAVNKLRADMVDAFISRGYPDAKISMDSKLGKYTYFPKFRIELGIRMRLLDVKVKGLKRTKPERLDQIVNPLEGEWYDEAAMNKKIRKLLATGAFNSARVETYEVSPKRINATLHLEEAKAKEISFSAGASTFRGPLLRAKYTDRNARGKLQAFTAGLEINARGLLGEIKLTDPWWHGTDLTNEYRWYSLIEEYEGYTTLESGIENRWKWEVSDHYSLSFLTGYSFVNINGEGLPQAFLGDSPYSHLRAGIISDWDYRDSPVLPKSGWNLSMPFQIGSAAGSELNSYLKFGLNGGLYYPISEDYQFGVGGFAEWVIPSGDSLELPIDLRVFNGGARSVRSFPERQLGPSFAGDPYGGDFSWAIQNELSRKIAGPLHALVFFDAGGVAGNYTPPVTGGLELAAGLGLRVELPIGALRIEYGHNLTQNIGEPSGTWHFAIGTTF